MQKRGHKLEENPNAKEVKSRRSKTARSALSNRAHRIVVNISRKLRDHAGVSSAQSIRKITSVQSTMRYAKLEAAGGWSRFLAARGELAKLYYEVRSREMTYSSAHSFSRRIWSSSSGVKSFWMLKVLRISSGDLPLIMLATVLQPTSSRALISR